jgi:hypothetical protein
MEMPYVLKGKRQNVRFMGNLSNAAAQVYELLLYVHRERRS